MAPKTDPNNVQDQTAEGGLVIEGSIEAPDPVQLVVETSPAAPDQNGRTFSADDIEKARREEKDKLYGTIQEMKDSLASFRKAEEDRKKAEEAAAKKAAEDQAKAEAEAKKKAEEEMEVRNLLAQKEQEWNDRFRQIEEDNARKDEILAKERRFNELMAYRSRRLDEEQDTIAPQLRDLVILGNSEQEIEASIADLQERTNRILDQIQQGQAAATRAQRTTSATAPPVGPLEAQPEFQQLSPQDLAAMDINTYAKNRDRLLGAVSQQVRQRGPYGG